MLDLFNTLVNPGLMHQTALSPNYRYFDPLIHTMASSSKGKQTLEDQYASLSLQNDDEEEVDLPFDDANTEDSESFMLVGTLGDGG